MEGFFLLGSLCILSSFSFLILSVDDTIPAEELFSIFEGTDVLLWVGGVKPYTESIMLKRN
jgi:hypothetical protein